MTIQIRQADFKDLLFIILVHSKSAQKAYNDILPDTVNATVFSTQSLYCAWQIAFYKANKNPNKVKLFVAEKIIDQKAKIIGVGQVCISDNHGHVETLCVHPDHQGHSIGKNLLTEMATFFKEKNVKTISVTIINGNNAAEEFYKHVGGASDKTTLHQDIIEASYNRGGKIYTNPPTEKHICQFNTWKLRIEKMCLQKI